MVEDVVEIGSNFQLGSFVEREEFSETHIDAPSTWSKQRISFRYRRVVKNVCASRRHVESSRIENLIRTQRGIRVTVYHRPERRTAEIANCINETTRDVAGKYRAAVVTGPERCKPGSA